MSFLGRFLEYITRRACQGVARYFVECQNSVVEILVYWRDVLEVWFLSVGSNWIPQAVELNHLPVVVGLIFAGIYVYTDR